MKRALIPKKDAERRIRHGNICHVELLYACLHLA